MNPRFDVYQWHLDRERNSRRSRTWLYRLTAADGTLLYVGVSADWRRRLVQHRRSKPWWADVSTVVLELHPSWRDATWAEGEAIRVENPLHNRAPGAAGFGSAAYRVPPMATIWQSAVLS